MKALEEFYQLKDGYATPTHYLGAEVKQGNFLNDVTKTKCTLSSAQYIKEVMSNIEQLYAVNQPLPMNYSSELDITPLLDVALANFYQSQISIL